MVVSSFSSQSMFPLFVEVCIADLGLIEMALLSARSVRIFTSLFSQPERKKRAPLRRKVVHPLKQNIAF